jgi:hypothetical protein
MGGVGIMSEVGVELLHGAVTVEAARVIVEVGHVPVPDFEVIWDESAEDVAVPLESDRADI